MVELWWEHLTALKHPAAGAASDKSRRRGWARGAKTGCSGPRSRRKVITHVTVLHTDTAVPFGSAVPEGGVNEQGRRLAGGFQLPGTGTRKEACAAMGMQGTLRADFVGNRKLRNLPASFQVVEEELIRARPDAFPTLISTCLSMNGQERASCKWKKLRQSPASLNVSTAAAEGTFFRIPQSPCIQL